MNKGIDMANGEIIGIINSDDWYGLDAVGLVVDKFSSKNLGIVYGDMYKFNAQLNEKVYFEGKISKELIPDIRLNHPTIFIKKEIYDNHGKFNTDYIVAADRELIFRLLQKEVSIGKIKTILANFRLGGTTSNLSFKFNLKRIIQEFEILYKYNVNILKIFLIISKQFFRLSRNHIFSIILGEKNYNYIRMKKLKISNKNDDNYIEK
jgi:hypothetical protein